MRQEHHPIMQSPDHDSGQGNEKNTDNLKHAATFSSLISVLCLAMTVSALPAAGLIFVTIHAAVMLVSWRLDKAAAKAGISPAPAWELYVARLPLAMAGFGIAFGGGNDKAVIVGAALGVLSGLFAGLADSEAWSQYRRDRMAVGGER
ncbi:hypothetical protein [Caenispirillum bisanense]|uniref:hypothetical protein n=1 Tax=Caenispirillum bisanense TaxID=414052 RepID=UPI0031DA00C5